MQHRSAPGHGLVAIQKHADANHLHAKGDRRKDHLVDAGWLDGVTGIAQAKLARNAESKNVRVNQADSVTRFCQGNCQVGCHR
ncbi:MAG: hypothetical protein RJA26_798 [Actinomycetota bacterium]